VCFYMVNLKKEKTSIDAIQTIDSVLDYVAGAQALVLFDIDETLLYPHAYDGDDFWLQELNAAKKRAGIVGGVVQYTMPDDTWWRALLHAEMQAGLTHEQMVAKHMPLLLKTSDKIVVKPMEHGTLSLVSNLQQQGCVVLGLTARSSTMMALTFKQLSEHGIDFTKTAPDRVAYDSKDPAYSYNHGVLFCGPVSKGFVLRHFLLQAALAPQKIVFIDDNMHHLKTVEDEMRGLHNVVYHGLHYQYKKPVV
jgi:hypothetical protein